MATVISPNESGSKSSERIISEPRARHSEKSKFSQKKAAIRRQRSMAERYPYGLNWPSVIWLVVLHVGAFAALFTFTWQAVVLTFVLHWITGGLGVCLGYHRLFTHRSFSTYKPLRWLIAIFGAWSGEGNVLDWVANHRKHHALSDKEGDPHSPHDGPWWSHMLWLGYRMHPLKLQEHYRRWAPDIAKDRGLQVVGKLFLVWNLLCAAMVAAIGYWIGGAAMAWSFVFWGVFVRFIFVLHSTWFVNSASHMWGYRNYETTDDSRNNWWVALLTYGEGWHNNHHAYPAMARHGHRWWEVDITYMTIKLMERAGLAWNVVSYKHRNDEAAAA